MRVSPLSLRKYIAFYKGRKISVEGKSSLDAQSRAAVIFNAKKTYEVTVMLADIEHSTSQF
jgi:hypothetical protein